MRLVAVVVQQVELAVETSAVIIMITRRLLAKRTALSKDEPLWRVLICRMLFDRDIPNREAWITQDRTKQIQS